MYRELLDVDRVLTEPVQQGPQRFGPAVAGNPEGQVLVVPRGVGQDPLGCVEFEHVGELEPDVAAGNQALEFAGSALGDQVALVEHRDPAGELICLFEVLGREEDGHAVGHQFAAVDDLLTGQENLQMMADLHHLRAGEGQRVVTSLLERFDLVESARKMASTYSGGMRRKLDLAMTLVTRPQIIFLDEPTTGLDPRSRRTMWTIVRELVADGVTVFLTTQNLDEADQLAGQIAVLDQGHLVAEGTPGELKRLVPGSHVRLQFTNVLELDAAARLLTGSTREDEDLTLRVPSDGRSKSLRALLDRLDEHSIDVEEFSVHTPDLDDVFLALTSHASTEAVAR